MPSRAIFVILFVTLAIEAHATVRNVPATYSTIQAAIEASVNGDTVLVAPGTYSENIVFRGKRIVVTSWFALGGDVTYIPNTIIDGSNPASPDSGSCVRIVNGEDSTAVLQGFTLTAGHGTWWNDEHGPGNHYWEGGGILIALSSPTIRYNIIRNNNVNQSGGVSTGGGGIRLGDGAPRILNNIIIHNSGMYGGGLVSNFASPVIRNNIVAFNTVSQAIPSLPTYGGGGLWFNGGVAGNRIENNTVVGNSSSGSGSVAAGRGGGIIAVYGATINTRNNIVWGNTQTSGGQLAAAGSGAVALAAYSDIEGGLTGQGNIDALPQFADTSFYLLPTSPCVDAGDTSAVFNDPPDPGNPALARWPSHGGRRNDIGVYGGPWSGIMASILTPVEEQHREAMPLQCSLSQNYPNPFNPTTTISYELSMAGTVSLKVYDILGREVTTLVDRHQQPGRYSVPWAGDGHASGTYIYKLTAGKYTVEKRFLLVK